MEDDPVKKPQRTANWWGAFYLDSAYSEEKKFERQGYFLLAAGLISIALSFIIKESPLVCGAEVGAVVFFAVGSQRFYKSYIAEKQWKAAARAIKKDLREG